MYTIVLNISNYWIYKLVFNAVADPATIGVGGGGLPPLPRHSAKKCGAPLDGNFKLYMNHCHGAVIHVSFETYPVNIFVINMGRVIHCLDF